METHRVIVFATEVYKIMSLLLYYYFFLKSLLKSSVHIISILYL